MVRSVIVSHNGGWAINHSKWLGKVQKASFKLLLLLFEELTLFRLVPASPNPHLLPSTFQIAISQNPMQRNEIQ